MLGATEGLKWYTLLTHIITAISDLIGSIHTAKVAIFQAKYLKSYQTVPPGYLVKKLGNGINLNTK